MKITQIIVLLFSFAVVFPQVKNERFKVEFVRKEISKIEIINNELINLFDTLLKEEKKCKYFTEFVSYKVVFDSIQDKNGIKYLVVSVLGYDNLDHVLSRNEDIDGYYLHNAHYFFMQGKSTCQFSEGKDNLIFKYRNLPPDDDDRWTIYRFVFHEKRFILYSKENNWLCN